jgi:ATP-dependent Clp protease ATP-binding subunit ClpA
VSIRFTQRVREALERADQEAQLFNHEYIGTEDILLGLVSEESGVAANVLKSMDVDLHKIRLEVDKIVQTAPGGHQFYYRGKLPLTPRAGKAMQYAVEEARQLNRSYVDTDHLLLGLLREEEGVAAQILMNLGVTAADVRAEVRRQAVDAAWLRRNGAAVESLARGIAHSRRWADLPILADALEEAGCEDRDILGHLRLGAAHNCGSGCWVLNRLLAAAPPQILGGQASGRRWWRFWG